MRRCAGSVRIGDIDDSRKGGRIGESEPVAELLRLGLGPGHVLRLRCDDMSPSMEIPAWEQLPGLFAGVAGGWARAGADGALCLIGAAIVDWKHHRTAEGGQEV